MCSPFNQRLALTSTPGIQKSIDSQAIQSCGKRRSGAPFNRYKRYGRGLQWQVPPIVTQPEMEISCGYRSQRITGAKWKTDPIVDYRSGTSVTRIDEAESRSLQTPDRQFESVPMQAPDEKHVMSTTPPAVTTRSFAGQFIMPAFWIFVVPILSLLFFLHAQSTFDGQLRTNILENVRIDKTLTDEDRAAWTNYFQNVPFSVHILRPGVADEVDPQLRFNYATFRWMIRLSVISLVGGAGVFLFAGICVWISMQSQMALYRCLSINWQVLRIYSAVQTVILGCLIFALSFWITALWLHVYYAQLIFFAGILSIGGIIAVIRGIFLRPQTDVTLEGHVLGPTDSPRLWDELQTICEDVGTNPPDQVIAGIDDNFFVTEQLVKVDGKPYRGRTLFVSLPLLKKLHSREADTILAHEMAHFSGDDTLFSERISPLLWRYSVYLQQLEQGGVTIPVFHFMMSIRALFELALGKLSRQREFRADQIAASITSPEDSAGALLRTLAYSKFRREVETALFNQQEQLDSADVGHQIERGFADYSLLFAGDPVISEMATAHPFDTHPPLVARLSALGLTLNADEARSILEIPGDGGWYDRIDNAHELEEQQWRTYEEKFKSAHQHSLPFRVLPATPAEQAIVETAFPAITFEGKGGTTKLDFEKLEHPSWKDALYFREIARCEFRNNRMLEIFFDRNGARLSRDIDIKTFDKQPQQQLLAAFRQYYGRYLAAAEFQKQLKPVAAEETASEPDSRDSGDNG